MSDLKQGDWVLLRKNAPSSWLKVITVSAAEVVVQTASGPLTVPRREVFGVADATTLDNPAPQSPTK
jgi:hypothetical protein